MKSKLYSLLFLLFFAMATQAQTTVLDSSWFVTNGNVNTLMKDGNTLYMGGTFTYIGLQKGAYGLPLNTATNTADFNYLKPDGPVYAVVSDGSGGWYIGGAFTAIGGVSRASLAHILANGSLDTWNPNIPGHVNTLNLDGTTIYVGGAFNQVGGTAVSNYAAISTTTGLTVGTQFSFDADILSIQRSGSTLYIGGIFTTVNGYARSGVAVVTSGGTVSSLTADAGGIVVCLLYDNNTLYVGGNFTTLQGAARSNAGAIDLTTGLVTSWNPATNNTVSSLAVDGSNVYIGGSFTTVSGFSKPGIAALTTSGTPTGWTPSVSGTVLCITISGGTMYIGGNFSTTGTTRLNFAAIDINSAAITSTALNTNNAVNALAVNGNTVYVGGMFNSSGGEFRSKAAAVDLTTRTITNWNPNVGSGSVNSIAVGSSAVYLGGLFTNVGGTTRSNLAVVNKSTGALNLSWNPGANATVNALVLSGSALYVGGAFTVLGGGPRSRLGAVITTTGALDTWNPNVSSTVNALTLDGATLYIGGAFASVGGLARNRAAAYDLITKTLYSWNPNANNTVNAIAVSSSEVYLGGVFSTMGGLPSLGLAAVSKATGGLSGSMPLPNSSVTALAVSNNTLYVGGNFLTVGGLSRTRAAAIDLSTKNVTSWSFPFNNTVSSIAASGSSAYLGGTFTTVSGLAKQSLAAIGQAITWYLDADNDGYYVSTQTVLGNPGTGWTSTLPSGGSGDCDDNNSAVWRSSLLYIDADGDGYTNGKATVCYGNTAPAGYSFTTKGVDCDDNTASAANNCPGTAPACTGWTYSRPISITATPSNYYQVPVTLSAGQYGNMQANGADLRFRDAADNNCTYYIESWNTSGNSVIWVSVPVAGTTSLTMYYGNGAASAASDVEGTFILYDDFSGAALNTLKWDAKTGTNSSVTVTGGELVLSPGTIDNQGAQVIAKAGFLPSAGAIVETTIGTGGTAPSTLCGTRASYCGATSMSGSGSFCDIDITTGAHYACWSSGRNGVVTSSCFNSNGSSIDYSPDQGFLSAGTPVAVSIENGLVKYTANNTLVYTSTAFTPSSVLHPVLNYFRGSCQPNSGQTLRISDIRVRKFTTGYNPSASVGAQTTLSCTATWLGNTTQWTSPANWSTGIVPNSCSHDAVIPTSPVGGLFPTIGLAAIQVGNLTVQDGATITVNNNSLSVCGNLDGGTSGNAVITGNANGSLVLNGTINQQDISGKLQLNTLRVNSSAGAVLQGAYVEIMTAVELQNGMLNTVLGSLRFRSTSSSQIAVLDDFSSGFTGFLVGPVTAERAYDAAAYQDAHYFGSPLSGPTAGSLGSANGSGGFVTAMGNCDETQLANNSLYGNVYSYNESNGASCNVAGWKVEAASTPLAAGKGYSVRKVGAGTLVLNGYVQIDQSYTQTGTNSNWTNTSLQGRPTVSGWTMVSNPYLATLDLTTAPNPNGYDVVHAVWNATGPFAGTYTDEDIIAPFQAFFVRRMTTGSPAYPIMKSYLTRSVSTTFQQQNNAETMTLFVTNTANGLKDKTTVGFNTDATSQYDGQLDAFKMPGALTRHTLYSYNSNPQEWLMRNYNTSIAQTSTVNVGFEPGVNGNYSMNFDGLQSFDPTSYITLEDKKLNIFHDVRSGDYSFTASTTDNWNRFVLHFTPAAKVNTTNASCAAQGQISIEQPGTANWNYTVANSNSVVVSSGSLNQSNPVTVSATPGVYIVTLTDANNYTVVKNLQITGASPIAATMTASANTAETGEDISFTSTTVNASSTEWNFGDGTNSQLASVTHHYATEGSYNVTLTVSNADGCNSWQQQTIEVTAKTATGITDLNNNKLNIWSNANRVYVDFSKFKTVEATVNIYNVLGQQLSSEQVTNSSVYSHPLNNTEVGYVLVNVKTESGILTKKLLITNE
ncbi:MAG: DUF2341 domain-containing protein [Chitinophagales bacterium]